MRYDNICSFTILVFWYFSFHMVTKASFCILQQSWYKAIFNWQGSTSQTFQRHTSILYTCLTIHGVLLVYLVYSYVCYSFNMDIQHIYDSPKLSPHPQYLHRQQLNETKTITSYVINLFNIFTCNKAVNAHITLPIFRFKHERC